MSDPQNEIRIWMQEELAKRPHGTKGRLAKFLGVRADAITRMANLDPKKETREIKAHEIDMLRQFFDEGESATDEPQLNSSVVTIVGYVGAGAEVEEDFEQVPEGGLEQIEVPFPLPDDMVAFEVRGESMLPMYDPGAVIIVFREQRKPLESFYGQRVIVRTSDGRRFIKTLIKGENGLVSLISWNANPIQNIEVTWIGEIFTVFPAEQVHRVARQVLKQGGIQGQLRLKA